MVAMNAWRRIASRSAGTCFDMMNGRPISSPPLSTFKSARCSSVLAKVPM